MEEKLSDFWDITMQPNICVNGVLGGKERYLKK